GGTPPGTAEEADREHASARRYMNTDGREIHWDFIRTLLASVAEVAIVPLQDVLGKGNEARMNLPGRPGGNWRWRYRAEELTPATQRRLLLYTDTYGRGRPRPKEPAPPA